MMASYLPKRNITLVDRLDFIYSGVDFNLPGNGGKECAAFLSLTQRFLESVFSMIIAVYLVWIYYPRLKVPQVKKEALDREVNYWGKRVMLVIMCLTFGVELGFKFATRQMIWIVNPCHFATMIQIYLLAAPPSKNVTGIFRLHMHILTGAPIALFFPVINTRMLAFEAETYYIQHIMMLVIPFYLMRMGGVYIPEQLGDFSWTMVSLGFLIAYHFIPLQIVALLTNVNLNNMLCPAISDPFHGPYYRLCALTHQICLIPTLGKLYAWIAEYFHIRPKHDYSEEEAWLVTPIVNNGDIKSEKVSNSNNSNNNGHLKQN